MFAVYMTVSVTFFTYYENWDASIALAYVIETMTSVGEFKYEFSIAQSLSALSAALLATQVTDIILPLMTTPDFLL